MNEIASDNPTIIVGDLTISYAKTTGIIKNHIWIENSKGEGMSLDIVKFFEENH